MTSTPEDNQTSPHVTGGSSAGRASDPHSSSSVPAVVYYYDNVTVAIVPEKKGLFLKHSEYEVCCRSLPIIDLFRCDLSASASIFLFVGPLFEAEPLRLSQVQ